MTHKHTPGPWIAEDVTGEKTLVYRRIHAAGKAVGFAGAYKLPNQKEAEANARLIAAAPKLLEALKDILGAIDEGHDFDPDNSDYVAAARAAIAEATGD